MNRVAKMSEEQRGNLITFYKEVLPQLGLDTHKKSKHITSFLNISGREWRKHVENIMHLYMYDYLDEMVIGTNKGYLLTGDKELIDRFLKAKEHQFKSLAYNCYNLKKSVLRKDNYTIDDFINESLHEQEAV